MRIARVIGTLGALAAACSKPTSPRGEQDTRAATLASGSTPSTEPVESSPVVAAPIDPATAPKVNAPMLRVPAGARLLIGINPSQGKAALSPAGDVLAIAGGSNGLQLLHVPTGRALAARMDLACTEPKADTVGPCEPALAFARDGKRVAAWWPLTKKLVIVGVPDAKTQVEATVEDVSQLAFIDDGRLVALHDGGATAYDAAGTRKELVATEGYASAIAHDGSQILVNGSKQRIVDVASGKPVAEPPGGVEIDGIAWAANGTRIATEQREWPNVIAWHRGDAKARTLFDGSEARTTIGGQGVHGVAVPPPYDVVYVGAAVGGLVGLTLDGKRVFSAPWVDLGSAGSVARTDHGGVVVLDGFSPLRLDATGAPVPGPFLGLLRPSVLAFDGDTLHAVPWGGGIAMTFDGKTGALLGSQPLAVGLQKRGGLAALRRDPALAARIEQAFKLPGVERGAIQLSRDGKRLFVVGDKATNSSIIDLTTMTAKTGQLPFIASGDGTRIAQQRMDSETRIDIRSVDGLRVIRSLDMPTTLLSRIELNTSGSILAAEGEGKVVVFDVASGKVLFDAPCQASYTGSLSLSKDGSRLACDTRAEAVVYDVRSKKRLKAVPHPDSENADELALSDDGRHLAVSNGYIVVVDL